MNGHKLISSFNMHGLSDKKSKEKDWEVNKVYNFEKKGGELYPLKWLRAIQPSQMIVSLINYLEFMKLWSIYSS